jgi:tetratricopeptide (TPR) repeat protein
MLVGVVLLGAGCKTAKTKKMEAHYGPSESVVEMVAVLRRHVPDDTYRFPAASDFTGRNVYRSSLLRLESIERLHADELRSGYMSPVIAFAKGRALERLRAYDLAAEHYREVARRDDALADEARRSAYVCEQIQEAVSIGTDLQNPLAEPDPVLEIIDDPVPVHDSQKVIAELDERIALLSFLLEEVADTHYAAVVKEEIERADEVRAAWFVDHRHDVVDGHLRGVAELQRVVKRHAASKRRLRHILALADYFDELAHEYVDAAPAESIGFDPAKFQELVDPTAHLYQSVASHDGTPEKIEAARKLEAFLAFTLVVDRDRFTP